MSKATGRHLLAICLATGSWSFSFGLGSQVITHWLKAWLGARSDSNAIIGRNLAVYYLGMGLAALAIPWLTRRLGKACAPIGLILSGLTLILFPWGGGLSSWFVLRFLSGAAGALCLVPLETLVSQEAAPEQRARNFSFYAVALSLGFAAGIWAGNHFYNPEDKSAFFLGGLCPILAGLALARTLPGADARASTSHIRGPLDWSRSFLSYGTAWFQGFLEGGMLAFLSTYLISLGMSHDGAGGLMSGTVIGVIAFQVPVAWLADRLGRLPVLLGCYAVVASGLLLMPTWPPSIGLALCLFSLGACAGALYPLALALLGDRLSEARLTRAYAWFMAMECVGNLMGSELMGEARDRWGETSMFGVGLAALATVLSTWALLLARQRRHQAVESTG